MELTKVRNRREELGALIEKYIGYKTADAAELRTKGFSFVGVNGYQCEGAITHIEHMPGEYFRVWSGTGFHVEWKPGGDCTIYAPFRVTGIPGTFSLIG